MNLPEFLQIIGLFGAVVGLYFNYRQLQANNRQKAAEFIISLNNSIVQNAEMNKIYYEIEYGKFEYNSSFHDSEKEIPLDHLLSHFESIAKLYLLSNFTLKDLVLSDN